MPKVTIFYACYQVHFVNYKYWTGSLGLASSRFKLMGIQFAEFGRSNSVRVRIGLETKMPISLLDLTGFTKVCSA